MKDLKVKDLKQFANVKIICENDEEILDNFKKDTHEVTLGDTYVGIKGEKQDGSIYFEKAFENGAKACIINNIIPEENIKKYKDKIIIETPDTIKLLQEIAKYKREMYDIPVIGITGSVGKTSTKDLIASVMNEGFNPTLKNMGNYNNHIGVPLTLLRLNEHKAAVIEMGMNHLGEISVTTKIAKPTMCVITNIGTSHIGNLGSRENILKAKLEILEGMKEEGLLIINNDNDMLHNWYLENKEKRHIFTYGIENQSNLMAKNIKEFENSSTFEVEINGKTYTVTINVRRKALCRKCTCSNISWNK